MNPIARWKERRKLDGDLAEEMADHIRERMEELVEAGQSEAEARRTAHAEFGNTVGWREASRSAWGLDGIENLWRDLLFACRILRKAPAFALAAFLTLALAVGAGTAVFTFVDSILLEPLTYSESGRLVVLWERVPFLGSNQLGPNPRHVDLWRQRASAFSQVTILAASKRGASPGSAAAGSVHPELTGSVRCEANLFDLLGVRPLLGRTFEPDEGKPGKDRVSIITDSLWRTMFHRDPTVIGKTIRLDDRLLTIVGVLPETFHFPNGNVLRPFTSGQNLSRTPEPAVFVPFAIDANSFGWGGDFGNYIVLARMKPGVGIQQADAQLDSIQKEVNRHFHDSGAPASVRIDAYAQPMREAIVTKSRATLWMLMAAILGLILIACLNLANTQLARSLSRRREMAIRTALGASRRRLIQTMLAEALVLGAPAGLTGIFIAALSVDMIRRFAGLELPRLTEVHLNIPVLLFSLALTLGSSLVCAVLPALRLSRMNPNVELQKSTARAAGTAGGGRVRSWLVGLEIFGATALLLFTALFSKSLLNLLREERGFDTRNIAVAEVDLPRQQFAAVGSRVRFDDSVLAQLRSISGIESAGMVSAMPLEGETFIEELTPVDRPNERTPLLNMRWASPGYFETMHERIVAGRSFEERDRDRKTMIVSEALARAVWPARNALGSEAMVEGRRFTVIGIVADARVASLKEGPVNFAYTHYTDRPPFPNYFVVRGKQSAESLVPIVRNAIWRNAPDVTIARVKTLDSQVADSLAMERFQTILLAAFGFGALALATLGIYSVLSYAVAGQRREIGVRMALGAGGAAIHSMVCGEAAVPVLSGLGLGLIAGGFGAKLIRTLLSGIPSAGVSAFVTVAAVFLATAAAAVIVPARRAARVNPVEALRSE